ncbi:MAG TPA: metal-dependent transcriptional regulator [Nitrospirota bacterium]|nr:metal-dependent transcriptional regulator [Nitrospirota bacterium]
MTGNMTDFNITHEMIDEFLEAMWILGEKDGGKHPDKQALYSALMEDGLVESPVLAEMVLARMQKDEYVLVKDQEVSFSAHGRAHAKKLIRRKRLAEKLLSEVFALDPDEIKSSACRFEHILSPEVTDSVCSFLGHPPSCPHGKPIPQGNCCKKLSHHMKPLVMPMKDLEPGSRARITFIAPRDHSRMDRLSTLGIVPGTEITLHQKKPAFVIRAGETELALDMEIAAEIYVKILS